MIGQCTSVDGLEKVFYRRCLAWYCGDINRLHLHLSVGSEKKN